MPLRYIIGISAALLSCGQAEWVTVYTEDFEEVPVGTTAGTGALANWEQSSAAGVSVDVF